MNGSRKMAKSPSVARSARIRGGTELAEGNKKRLDKQVICEAVIAGRTMQAIATEYGVSRERVRQILMSTMGLSARDLRITKERPISVREIERYFAEEANRNGIQPVYQHGAFICFGKSVVVQIASPRQNGFFQIMRSRQRCDFAAWMFPEGHWLILPHKEWPATSTMISIGLQTETGRGISRDGKKHGYFRYIDRWDFLGGKVKINDAINATEIPNWRNRQTKYLLLIEKLKTLPDGLALPVECEDIREAQNCQYALFGFQNKKDGPLHGEKYTVARRKNMVYITRAQG